MSGGVGTVDSSAVEALKGDSVGFALNSTLLDLSARTKQKFESMPKVIGKDGNFSIDNLKIGDEWHRLSDLVAVMVDLKSSTNLAKGKKPASVASIYDAGMGGVVKIFKSLDSDFVDIQGDGGFALFWGEKRFERAFTAAVTVRTFSDDLVKQIYAKWSDEPETGFKVAIASGPVLVKLVGLPRKTELQEPVWAGRPVNYAAKAAQQTEPTVLLVTASVWDELEDNEYIVFSCGCNGPTSLLWEDYLLEKIPDDEKWGKALKSTWCAVHGEEFCNSILGGEKRRDDVDDDLRHKRNQLSYGTVEKSEAYKRRARLRTEGSMIQKSLELEGLR